MASALFTMSLLMIETTSRFIGRKVVLELSSEEKSIQQTPFPAVTICPEYVRKDKRHEHINFNSWSPLDNKYETIDKKLSSRSRFM